MTRLAVSPLGVEALDSANCAPDLARATLDDFWLVNTLFGGRQAAAFGLRRLLRLGPAPRTVTLLDLGAGAGDIAAHCVRAGAAAGVTVRPVALDWHRTAARMARERGLPAVVADAGAPPIARRTVDIVLVSQFLHHLTRPAGVALLRTADRLARLGVVVADARRSPAAALGIRLAGLALRVHPATRHDGVLSVRRSFTARELRALLVRAGIAGTVHRRPGFRLVAVWRTAHAHG